LRCPSRVGMLGTARGAASELDVVVAQLGTDALNEHANLLANDQAYVHTLRLQSDGVLSVGTALLDPFTANTGNLTLLPATHDFDTLLVVHQHADEETAGTLSILPLLGEAPATTFPTTSPALPRSQGFVT